MEQAAIAGVQESRRVVESRSDHPGEGKMLGKGSVEGKRVYAPRCRGAKMGIPAQNETLLYPVSALVSIPVA
jgi:hypothetical protein